MVGHGQVTVPVALIAAALVVTVPTTAGNAATYCTDSAGFGEVRYASCYLEHPTCGGGCDWPDVHIRVWAEDGLEGTFTPIVAGAIEFTEVCRDSDECSNVVAGPQDYGGSLFCHGYGPEDGIILASTEVVNAPWAVHMECWTE